MTVFGNHRRMFLRRKEIVFTPGFTAIEGIMARNAPFRYASVLTEEESAIVEAARVRLAQNDPRIRWSFSPVSQNYTVWEMNVEGTQPSLEDIKRERSSI